MPKSIYVTFYFFPHSIVLVERRSRRGPWSFLFMISCPVPSSIQQSDGQPMLSRSSLSRLLWRWWTATAMISNWSQYHHSRLPFSAHHWAAQKHIFANEQILLEQSLVTPQVHRDKMLAASCKRCNAVRSNAYISTNGFDVRQYLSHLIISLNVFPGYTNTAGS